VNEAAVVGTRISDYDAQLKKLQQGHEAAVQELEEMLKPLRKKHRNASSKLGKAGVKIHQLNATITDIDRVNGRGSNSEELKQERAQFQLKRGRNRIELERIETEERGLRGELEMAQEKISALRKAFEHAQMLLAEDIRQDARRKQELERKLSGMEEAKHQPFREIGRMLADAGIFPRNQPESLDKVLNLRKQLVMIDGRLEESREISRSFERGELVMFYVLTGGILAGLVALVSWVLH
jgi:chromosome segregation ATPase